MPRAKQRTPELRDRVLDVAITTLGDEGIARFTTRRVAERAGTSVPAVYELFDDKEACFLAAFDSVVEVIEQLGSETLLDVKVGPNAMVAAVPPTTGLKIRDQIRGPLNLDNEVILLYEDN